LPKGNLVTDDTDLIAISVANGLVRTYGPLHAPTAAECSTLRYIHTAAAPHLLCAAMGSYMAPIIFRSREKSMSHLKHGSQEPAPESTIQSASPSSVQPFYSAHGRDQVTNG